MERLMLLWDILDDWAAAARHVTASTADELVEIGPRVAGIFPMLVTWLLAA